MEERAAYFTRLMVQKGVRTFGDLMFLMNKPPGPEDTAPALSWSFTITLEDVCGADPSLVSMFGQTLTNAARERMMREYGLFVGRSHADVEHEIVKLRSLEDRCEACGHNLYNGSRTCEECGTVAAE